MEKRVWQKKYFMKVLHVISHFSESYAGMAIACKEIAENQTKVGIHSTVITSNLDYPTGIMAKSLIKPIFENGVKIRYCPVLFKSFVFSFKLIKIIIKYNKYYYCISWIIYYFFRLYFKK